jgi:Protein of unknown function (DUF2975)
MRYDMGDLAMARIRRLSSWGRFAALTGFWLLIIIYAVAVAMVTPENFLRAHFVHGDQKLTQNVWLIGLGYLLVFVALVPYGVGLQAAGRLLGLYAEGRIFSEHSAVELARIGWSVALLPPISNSAVVLGGLALTWNNPPGQVVYNIGLGTADILALVYGVLLIVVGSVLREAALMSDDHRHIV